MQACKRVVALLVLLAFAGQSLAIAVSPCHKSNQSPAGPMAGDSSAHRHDQGRHASALVKSDAMDCCAQGDRGCLISGCVSIAMMSTPQQPALPFIRIALAMDCLDWAQSQCPASLYRPPISC